MADEDLIQIKHTQNPGARPRTVRRDAFEQIWRLKGYDEVDPVATRVSEALKLSVDSLDELKKEQLSTAAARIGVDVDPKATKSQLIESLTDALAPATEDETTEEAAVNG